MNLYLVDVLRSSCTYSVFRCFSGISVKGCNIWVDQVTGLWAEKNRISNPGIDKKYYSSPKNLTGSDARPFSTVKEGSV